MKWVYPLLSVYAFSLMFPMETLFERYVAVQLKKFLPAEDFSISIQDATHYLFTQPNKKFILRPDIVITRKHDNAIFICDTKWKLLSSKKSKLGNLSGGYVPDVCISEKNTMSKTLQCSIQ